MRITATVAEQLRFLLEYSEDDGELLAGLGSLSRDVALAVPATLAVTILLVRQDREVGISAFAEPGAVLASLAVRLPVGDLGGHGDVGGLGGQLVLRAGTAGAYLLLAADLNGLLGPDRPPVVLDEHLHWPTLSSPSLAASLSDLRSINQAIGVLTDRGLPPAEARGELRRRATAADATVAAVSGDLLGTLRRDSRPAPHDDPAGTAGS